MALGQTTLGEVLDAKPRKLSPEQFKDEVVQRALVGPSPAGGVLELVYTSNGTVQGTGNAPQATFRFVQLAQINGQWTIGEGGGICTSLRFTSEGGGSVGGLYLPPRCQHWFRVGDRFFLADSDTDRSAKVLVRTIKQ
ncbi:MAG: hypothetical protein U1F58_02965 [Burkholderiales bacterium]